ncbi:MAG: hypothetical protein SPI77_06310 [Corynebacterium sp.]|nr:hypothetical protein [Corynebacterium sp.]
MVGVTPVSAVSTLLRLQRTLWWRTIRENPAVLIMAMLLIIYAAGGTIMMCYYVWLDAAAGSLDALAGAVALGTAAFLLLSLAIPSGENQLNPKALAPLPLAPRRLVLPLTVGSLLQTRGFIIVLCTTAATVCAVIPLVRHGAVGLALAVCAAMVGAAVTTLVIGQAVTSLVGRDRSDRGQKLAGVLTAVLIFASIIASNAADDIYGRVAEAGGVLAYTPFAASIGVVAVEGVVPRLLVALIAVGTVAVMLGISARSIARELRVPLAGNIASAARTRSRSVVLPGLPATAFTAVLSATVRTMLRDSRTLTSLVFTPAFIFYALWMYYSQTPHPVGMMVMAGFITALSLGSMNSNAFGLDGGAAWQIIGSRLSPRTWLAARMAGGTAFPALLLLVYLVVYLATVEPTGTHLALFVGFIGFALTAVAIAVELSVRMPYPVAPPGTNPWQDRSNGGQSAWIAALVVLIGGWVPLIPGFLAVWVWQQPWIAAGCFLVIPAAVLAWAWSDAARYFAGNVDSVFATVR